MTRKAAPALLRSFTLEDDLAFAGERAVEVTVTLADGRVRWCFFMTPSALASCGDWVEGTRVPLHLGEPHMIVVGQVTPDIVARVLRQIDAAGELERRTLPLG